jgi:outer membrane protein OmpA-like peptidoglycan-associated protein
MTTNYYILLIKNRQSCKFTASKIKMQYIYLENEIKQLYKGEPMKQRITLAVLILLLLAVSTFAVEASKEIPIINKYGQTGLWNTHSARTAGQGRLIVNAHLNYSGHEEFVRAVTRINPTTGLAYTKGTPNDQHESFADFSMTAINISLGYGITRFLDLSATMPIYVDYFDAVTYGTEGTNSYDWFPNDQTKKTFSGQGDLKVSMTFQYPPYAHRRFFEMAYYGALTLPTGNSVDSFFPKHMYYHDRNGYGTGETPYVWTAGENEFEIDMLMLWTMDFRELAEAFPVMLHTNYGLKWTTAYESEHTFLFNAGLEIRPLDWLAVFLEFSAEPRFGSIQGEVTETPKSWYKKEPVEWGSDDSVNAIQDTPKRSMLSDPMRLSPGIAFLIPGGFNLTAGVDISVSDISGNFTKQQQRTEVYNSEVIIETAVEPKLSLAASLGWAGFVMPQDNDKDGIKDKDDNCPNEPEDYDGYKDTDGCPEFDNDNDGIPDSTDKCVNDPEDLDGFEDEDGCPELDNDEDGVADVTDKCPADPEDLDGFEDEDGCPELDNDKDGIVDSVDACIDSPEDKDGYKDEDGCPEVDNDMDGIADSLDKCPNEAETFNTFEDEDGCPDTKPVVKVAPKAKEISRAPMVLNGVTFRSGKAELTSGSFQMLNEVAFSLKEWPETKIEVQGHTDSQGGAAANKKLSYKRARAVMDYIVSQGVSGARLRAVGMGEEQPVADNATASGRSMNRRVELHRID